MSYVGTVTSFVVISSHLKQELVIEKIDRLHELQKKTKLQEQDQYM